VEGFDLIRHRARLRHAEARAKRSGANTASALLDGATDLTGVGRQAVPDDDPVLCGAEAVLDRSAPAIFYKQSVEAAEANFYQAHEFAHHWLDGETSACVVGDIDDSMPEERIPLGIQRVEGYGQHERRECQANVFAREFLLPTAEARRLFVEERLLATAIAQQLGVPLGMVHQQLALALLVPDAEINEESVKRILPPLDDSQRAAAEAEGGPHLIEAGPGTGKTRTLTARIEWLVNQGIEPASILALTFSNKAAEEMRERVAVAAPDAAPAIWAGTFHSFGLELLRKYGQHLGLPPEVRVIDPGDALLLLEEMLPSLPLKHYLQLYEPALALHDILRAISRAKDELITPQEYRAFGDAVLASESGETAREEAERVLEVAAVFAAYEEMLESEHIVDFSGLISKPIALLRDHPEVLEEVRAQYKQILVDEYQDVNRASGVLLKLLAGDGKGLWVVGDARQSIYRFRGAAPANIREFTRDFPGTKKLSLNVNYRSQEQVVRLLEVFASDMKAGIGGLPARWEAKRGRQGGEIVVEVAPDLAAEAAGLAGEINRRRDEGVRYRDQAILCRSHTNLVRFAQRLEAHGVPILYLGDLFERPEIRDMLALLSFTCEAERGGLFRLAQFPEYRIPITDARKFLNFAAEKGIYPTEALRSLDDISELTAEGRNGLQRLAAHVGDVEHKTTPAALLFDYLFTKSRYLDSVLADGSISGQQKRLALYQLLQFALEHKHGGRGNWRRHLLRWIRRLETFGEERQLRELPSAAREIDAVRLLTVHASKGLEFSTVYLPALGTGMFPVNPQYNPCPPPRGMLPDDPKESHFEEEECLFFVGISRARDVLCLSRAESYGMTNRSASALLLKIEPYVPRSSGRWKGAGLTETAEGPLPHLGSALEEYAAEDLDQYIKCPRAYLYQRILGLSGARDDDAYVRFHRAVYSVLRWMGGIEASKAVGIDEAFRELRTAWEQIGPADHPYSRIYQKNAETIIERAIARRAGKVEIVEMDWQIKRPAGQIRLKPDHVEIGEDGPVVRRLRTGKPPKKIDDNIYALYHEGAKQVYGKARVEALFLTADEIVPVELSAKMIASRLQKYDEAIAGIRAGEFPPQPSDRMCPRCPQYFICPALPGADCPPKKS
jgi:ATP-dependent DNA helicase UvrD/PcrA